MVPTDRAYRVKARGTSMRMPSSLRAAEELLLVPNVPPLDLLLVCLLRSTLFLELGTWLDAALSIVGRHRL